MADLMTLPPYPKDANAALLLDELMAAIPALASTVGPDGQREGHVRVAADPVAHTVTIAVPAGTSEPAVAAVVAAHNAALPGPGTAQEATDTAALEDVKATYTSMLAGLDTIRTHMTAINAGPAAPTATQTGTALKTLAADLTTVCNGSEKLLKALRVWVRRSGLG